MKFSTFILSIFLVFNSSFITSNVITRQNTEEIIAGYVEQLQGLPALDSFSRRPNAGNDDPTPVIIENAGYPVETHMVTTDDGYILTMHRIPFSKNNPNKNADASRLIVFVQHGLLCSSADWVLADP